jgi:WD40 repeat protein
MRSEASETNSMSDAPATTASVNGATNDDDGKYITAIACHPDGLHVFVARASGSVCLYSTIKGEEVATLYQHASPVIHLTLGSDAKTIVSADISSRVLVWRLASKQREILVERPITEFRLVDEAITQILLSQDERSMLVSTLASDCFYDLHDGRQEVKSPSHRGAAWKWINYPGEPSRLIHITAEEAHIHSWADMLSPTKDACLKQSSSISSSLLPDMTLKDVLVCQDHCRIAVEFANVRNTQSTLQVLFFATRPFKDQSSHLLQPLNSFAILAPCIEHLIGVIGNRVYFLNRRMWLCSFDIESFQNTFDQHCCIPDDWFSPDGELVLKVTSKGDFLFVVTTELAVIKQAKNFKEIVRL